MDKNLRILITGARGFVGRHLCKKLIENGYKNLIQTSSSYSNNYTQCDLLIDHNISWLFTVYKPDIVIHLAAVVGGIGANKKYPGEFCYQNMIMGLNIVEACRIHNIKKLVFLSTVCAYPNNTTIPFKEESLWLGYPSATNAPYGIAKKAVQTCMDAYRAQYNLNGITLIPVNMYGPEESNLDKENSHVIPALILKVLDAKYNNYPEITCWGSGKASREFLYVEDCVEAIILAMEKYDKPEPINIGTCSEITIKDLTEMICDIMGYKGNIIWDTTQPDGQPRRCLDISKAKKEFKFKAKTSLRDGLVKTIEWMKHV